MTATASDLITWIFKGMTGSTRREVPNARKIILPSFVKRGQNKSKTKRGWRIVNPNGTRTFKAAQVTKFNSSDGELFMVFRILFPTRGEQDE